MVQSVQTSAHVQSFIEVDVTNIVKWRDKVKNAFEKREETFRLSAKLEIAEQSRLAGNPAFTVAESRALLKKRFTNEKA